MLYVVHNADPMSCSILVTTTKKRAMEFAKSIAEGKLVVYLPATSNASQWNYEDNVVVEQTEEYCNMA